jgi:leukotriene-A4 hydrolase
MSILTTNLQRTYLLYCGIIMIKIAFSLLLLILAMQSTFASDPHSCARPDLVRVHHMSLSFTPDFNTQSLTAVAVVHIDRYQKEAPLMLDIKGLQIQHITDAETQAPLIYILHPDKPFLGQALQIVLSDETRKVKIQYSVPKGAPALQWLDAAQTQGKTHPFLYSQSQAILARTWIPIQDSPGCRATFDAEVFLPKGMIALMSATNPTQISEDGHYTFKMDKPIPAYLMSIAAGNLEFQKVGERTGVYAEPPMLQTAVKEFSEMQQMLETAENLYGKYQWDRYDVLVLPPSFPFGGMENPMITYATPTIIAGDKSLVSLIAHELAHSWSGNLVTNATWDDFWLNEGFTVYFERRIMEEIMGRPYAEMLEVLGWQDVLHTIEDFGHNHPATCLKLNLQDKDPDDGMNDIAYEKGFFLLRAIENAVGRPVFDDFLKWYFSTYAFKSMDTERFLEILNTRLLNTPELQAAVNAERWIYQPGMPESAPKPSSEKFGIVDASINSFLNGNMPAAATTTQWSTHEWLHFLRHLPETLSTEQRAALDQVYQFTQTGNSEIAFEWFLAAYRYNYLPAFDNAETFLIQTGRRKFIVPLYKELLKTEAGAIRARHIYQKARAGYHFVATSTLDALIHP